MPLHRNMTFVDGHVVHSFEYADAAARTAATGFVIGDEGRIARQLDDNTFWVLVDATGPTWTTITAAATGDVSSTRQVIAGAGLTGGGNLAADRTFDVVANADGSIVVNANDIQVGVLATDAQHGDLGGNDLHSLVVAGGNAGFMSGTDKQRLDDMEDGAQAVTFAHVADALGTAAGVANYVFKSDGAGSGTMVKNTQVVPRKIIVGASGDVDYTSVATAVTAAVSGGASGSTPWVILVNPGSYTEPPFTLPTGVVVTTQNGQRHSLVFLTPSSPTLDFITGTGGTLCGVDVRGVTDAAKACIRVSSAGQPTVLISCSLTGCSNGVIIEGGGTALAFNLTMVALPFSGITTGIKVTGTGSKLILLGGLTTCPSAFLPLFAINPIETAIWVTAGAKATIQAADFDIAPKNSSQKSILVDGANTECTILAGTFETSYTAVELGSSGTNAKVIIQGGLFSGNTTNISLQSSTGTCFVIATVDSRKITAVTGATVTGSLQNQSTGNTEYIGGAYEFPLTGKQVDLATFYSRTFSSAIGSGGAVTDNGGLSVNVAAGAGSVRRSTTYTDWYTVTWSAATLTLTASSTNYVIYSSTTETITHTPTSPSDEHILLATVITDGGDIRFIHHTGWTSAQFNHQIREYLYDTRRVILKSGLGASLGSSGRKFDVDVGVYYLATSQISYGGAADAAFSYFYGADGATEVASQTQTSITQYDLAGTLTSMTASYYRADTLYLTSDDRLSLIYGTAQYSTQIAAEAVTAASPMSFIEQSAIAIALIVSQQGNGIVSFVDLRPTGTASSSSGGGGGVTDHGLLTGLSDDDHPIYLLASGARAMGGNLDMGTNNVTNVGLVDGVDVSAHEARHLPGGTDALTTAAPTGLLVGGSNTAGSAASFSRSDHIHEILRAAPVDVGSANSAGSASTFSGSDHVHAHGTQAGGTLHADVIAAGASGFMSGTDKTKLDGVASGATNLALASSTPAAVGTAAVGVGTTAARADHVHAHGTQLGGTLHADVIAAGASGFMSGTDKTKLDGLPSSAVATTRTVTAGAGLTGGGDLSADRTFNVVANADASIVVNADDIRVGVLATDAQHGVRGGGTQHANVVAAGAAGFMTGTDKTKLDGLSNRLLQTIQAEPAYPASTSSTTYVDLISQAITITTGSHLLISFSVSTSNTNAGKRHEFQIVINGTAFRATAVSPAVANGPEGASMFFRVANGTNSLVDGANTIKIQWKTSANTASITPASRSEHASLVLQEVTV